MDAIFVPTESIGMGYIGLLSTENSNLKATLAIRWNTLTKKIFWTVKD